MKIKAPTLHKKATKAITRTHVATVAQHQLKETIKSTKENVGKMHEHLTISEDLIEIGIHTEISRNFEKFLSNPVEAFSEYTQGIISNWNVLVLKSATEFFTKRKKNISSVYYENMPNNICFYVILKS
jgi:hypothetical protein